MKRTYLALIVASLAAPAFAQEAGTLPSPAAAQEAAAPAQEPVRHPAVPPVPPAEAAYYEREAALARQKRLLDLEMEILEKERELAGQGASTQSPAPANSPTVISRVSAPAPSSAVSAAASRSSARPNDLGFTVVSIWGPDDDLRAQILSHGLRLTVREGDELTNGWVVHRVARTGLVISKGRSRRTVMIGG